MEVLLMLFVFGLIGLVLLVVALAVIGSLLGLAFSALGFLLFNVAPVLLVGWLVVKLVRRSRSRSRISAADQRWLDS